MNRTLQLVSAIAGVSLGVALFAACGGGSSSDSSKTASPGSSGAGTSTSATNNSVSQKSGSLCGNIKQADVQALLPSPITSVADDGLADCLYKEQSGSSLDVTIYNSDPDEQYYKTLSLGSSDHQLSGVGDEAYWNEAVPGRTSPELSAHKGKQTCVIQSNDPPDTTLKVTITNVQSNLFTVTDEDSAAYAVLMGKVCADYLNGI